MVLLEREAELRELHGHFQVASGGSGRLVFLGGEGGGGKSSLIEEFRRQVEPGVPFSVVSFDGVALPSAFGALHELAGAWGQDIGALLEGQAPREQVIRAMFERMCQASGVNVLVGEDAHHTDEASLELVRYIGRRIGQTRTLFIVTYRDDALHAYHPLRRVLGDLVSEPNVVRMSVCPLSLDSVRELAHGSGHDASLLFERTNGNPFYVTEIIAAGGDSIPATVQDAVLARASRVSIEGRALLTVAAAIGIVIDPDALARVIGGSIDADLDECLASGILRVQGDQVAFRHGIARDVLYDAISPSRKRGLHRRILEILEQDPSLGSDESILAHHADRARQRPTAYAYALKAARMAATIGAHREAAAQFDRAIRNADGLAESELVDLETARAQENYFSGDFAGAVAAQQRAMALLSEHGSPLAYGGALGALARYLLLADRITESFDVAQRARSLLESLPPGEALAEVYSLLAHCSLITRDVEATRAWGGLAIALAQTAASQAILAETRITLGTVEIVCDLGAGQHLLEAGIANARASGQHVQVARGFNNLVFRLTAQAEPERALALIDEGLAYEIEHGLTSFEVVLRAFRSWVLLDLGDWEAAGHEAAGVLVRAETVPGGAIVARIVLGKLKALRGGDASEMHDDALMLARDLDDRWTLGMVRAARAEAAWLAGDPHLAVAEAAREYGNAIAENDPWLAGELALWMHRGGHRVTEIGNLAEPFARELSGRSREAAAFWAHRGMRVPEARSLAADGGDAELRAAHHIFDMLGARPDLTRVVRALRAAGATNIPRGPRPETRANAAGLTARELEILELVMQRKTNKQIAEQLYLSHRTVGHHVSAILGKLDVDSRDKLRDKADELMLLQDRSLNSPNQA